MTIFAKITIAIVIIMLGVGAYLCAFTLSNCGHPIMACSLSFWTGVIFTYVCKLIHD